MHDQAISPFPDGDSPGVYVADGYGIKVHVRRRHLVVSDGFGSHRRERRFHKATTDLRRLVVLGHTGYVTFEALRWMADAKVGYLQLDRDNTILAATGAPGVNKAELRRAQVLAATNQLGIGLTRMILARKLDGQARVAQRLPNAGAAEQVREKGDEIDGASDLNTLRLIESQAALAYWDAWRTVPVGFVRAHRNRVPDHWHTFGTRGSSLATGPRLAANPANAVLNYLYALLEAEATIVCTAVGLDPGLGILHSDQRFRASLALDLMEAIRPDVDGYLLDLLGGHVFRAGDFTENRRGVCRILPPLTHHLADTLRLWGELVAPIVEQAVAVLTNGRVTITPVTQNNRRASPTKPSPRTPSTTRVQTHCADCSKPIPRDRKLCDECAESSIGRATDSNGSPASETPVRTLRMEERSLSSEATPSDSDFRRQRSGMPTTNAPTQRSSRATSSPPSPTSPSLKWSKPPGSRPATAHSSAGG